MEWDIKQLRHCIITCARTPASQGSADREKGQRGESLYLPSTGLDIFLLLKFVVIM